MTQDEQDGPDVLLDPRSLEEASRWMTRIRAGIDDSEQAALHAWLRQDLAHARALDAVTRTWEIAQDLGAVPAVRAGRALDTAYLADRGARAVRRARLAFASVAALILCAGAAVLWQAETKQELRYATGAWERLEIRLDDGSQVRLDVRTQLTANVTWRKRELVLDGGSAEFVVAHDRLRPFTVATEKTIVRAVGTDFAVRRDRDETSVVLVSGVVDLQEPKSGRIEARLKPSQKATFSGSAPLAVVPVKPADELAWRQGQIVFDRVRLGDAVRRFASYTSSEIRLAPELAQIEVSGVYKTDELMVFLNNLARVAPLRWHRDESGAYVIRRIEKS